MLRKTTLILLSVLICIIFQTNMSVFAISKDDNSKNDINVIVNSSSITVINNSQIPRLVNITITCHNTDTGQIVSSSGNSSVLSYGQSLTALISGYSPSTFTYWAHVVVYNSNSYYSGVYYTYDCELGS